MTYMYHVLHVTLIVGVICAAFQKLSVSANDHKVVFTGSEALVASSGESATEVVIHPALMSQLFPAWCWFGLALGTSAYTLSCLYSYCKNSIPCNTQEVLVGCWKCFDGLRCVCIHFGNVSS